MRAFLLIFGTSTLLAGCSLSSLFAPVAPTTDPVLAAPLFCDAVVRDFRWTQAQWDARLELDPGNLREELRLNELRVTWCDE